MRRKKSRRSIQIFQRLRGAKSANSPDE
jgi:hypothetical protein